MAQQKNHNVGIYTGTFDPVHQGHLAFCMDAINVANLEKLYLVPESTPRGKQGVSSLPKRMALISQAIAALPEMQQNIYPVELNSPTFTVKETLPELRKLCGNANIHLLIGSDVAKNLAFWEGLPELLSEVTLIISLRGEDTAELLMNILRQIETTQKVTVNFRVIQSRHPTLASSQMRLKT